ncbi:MAG: DUF2782 domain-containing protein [Bermanella sp.]
MNLIRTYLLMACLLPLSSFAMDTEPSIIITHSEDKTFYEYSLNGQILEIKVVPKVGPTYYLVPHNDQSQGFQRQGESSLVIPKWVIFSW